MPTDLDILQGRWHVASLEADGVTMTPESFESAEIVVKGKTFTSKGMGATYKGVLELHPSTKPKSFDLVFSAGPEKGNRNLGIYEIAGDAWKICLATTGTTRPRAFATAAGTGFALETLVREVELTTGKASGKKAPKTAGRGASGPEAAGAPTAIEGEWAMESAVFNGKPMAANMVKWASRITRGNVTTVVAGPQTILKAEFTLGAAARPGTIDYVNLAGSLTGKAQSGIWELSGDTLRVCMSPPSRPRPDEFSSKAGDERSFTTWRRTKP